VFVEFDVRGLFQGEVFGLFPAVGFYFEDGVAVAYAGDGDLIFCHRFDFY